MITDTCFPKCRYYESRESCPDFFQTVWADGGGTTKTIEDCARRRQFLMSLKFESRVIGLQQAVEQERNMAGQVRLAVAALIEVIRPEIANATAGRKAAIENISSTSRG